MARLLTILRRPVDGDQTGRERTARLLLIGWLRSACILWTSLLRDFRIGSPPCLACPHGP